MFTASSGCVAKTTSVYCESGDAVCYACLSTWSNKDACRGSYGCVCLQQCESMTSYGSSSSTNSPSSSIQSSFDDAAAKMDSDFNHSRNIFIGCAVGIVALGMIGAIFSNCRRRRARQQYCESRSFYHETWASMKKVFTFTLCSCYIDQGTGTGDRVWRSDEPTRLGASSPGMGRHFAHETAVVVNTAYDDSSSSFNFTSDVPFAQAVDCTPSAPTYDNSSMSAPAMSTTTSSYD